MYAFSRRSPKSAMNCSRSAGVRACQCRPRHRREISVKSKLWFTTARILFRRSAVLASFLSSGSVTIFRTRSMDPRSWSVGTPAPASRAARSDTTAATATSGRVMAGPSYTEAETEVTCEFFSTLLETVKLLCVVAEDAAARRGRDILEIVLDGLPGVGPGAVGVRVVGGPHHPVLSEDVEQAQPRVVDLKRGPDLPPEVRAGLHRQREPSVAAPVLAGVQELLVRVVHPLEHVGQPTDAGLGQHDPKRRVALERAGEDHARERLVHLERRARHADAHVPRIRRLGPAAEDGAQAASQMEPQDDAGLRR